MAHQTGSQVKARADKHDSDCIARQKAIFKSLKSSANKLLSNKKMLDALSKSL